MATRRFGKGSKKVGAKHKPEPEMAIAEIDPKKKSNLLFGRA
jgi:hypothetical protein